MVQFNQVIVVGNIVADPEVRQTRGGTAVCNLRLAINERYKTNAGEVKNNTLFIDVTTFGTTAENVGNYCKKGSQIMVIGKLSEDKWTDKETGKERKITKINALSVQFMPSGNKSTAAPAEGEESSAPVAAPAGGADDDLPF
jgi:single-strand DNA-binding protein